MHVLIVDDDEATRFVVKRALGKMGGIQVSEASSGEDALGFLDVHSPDVVLSDYRMPGMSGIELLCLVRERHPHLARLLMSGTLHEDLLKLRAGQGCAEFIFEKPTTTETWAAILGTALGHLGVFPGREEVGASG
jgi:DNA-binding NtrC family response regulator